MSLTERFVQLLRLGASENEHEGRSATAAALAMIEKGKVVLLEASDTRLRYKDVPPPARRDPVWEEPPWQPSWREEEVADTEAGWFLMVMADDGRCVGCHRKVRRRERAYWHVASGSMRHRGCPPKKKKG